MLRGAIDHTTANSVSGWLYSEFGSVRDQEVMAFIDGLCVGAGRIDRFRKDLLDAGLGDGYLGFSFGISPLKSQDVLRAYIKMAGSDLAIIQNGCRVVSSGGALPCMPRATRLGTSLEWFRSRGWLEQSEYDFLKYLNQFGVFDRSLRLTKTAAGNSGIESLEPSSEAKALFDLLLLDSATVESKKYESVTALASDALFLAEALPEPIVAVSSQERGHIMVAEGSHEENSSNQKRSFDGAIEYAFGSDRLLFLNLYTSFKPQLLEAPKEIQVYYPVSNVGTSPSQRLST